MADPVRREESGISVTDGERLVWAASYALALEHTGDSITAVRTAANAIAQLREASNRRAAGGNFVIWELDERSFLDEIVNVP
jgi:hypothetical protein